MNDVNRVGRAALGVLEALEDRETDRVIHEFAPQGLSVVVLGERARVAIHTWPEWRTASVDVWAASSSLESAIQAAFNELSRP